MTINYKNALKPVALLSLLLGLSGFMIALSMFVSMGVSREPLVIFKLHIGKFLLSQILIGLSLIITAIKMINGKEKKTEGIFTLVLIACDFIILFLVHIRRT